MGKYSDKDYRIKELHDSGLGSVLIARKLSEEFGGDWDDRAIRKRINKMNLRDSESNDNYSETRNYDGGNDIIQADAFKQYCIEEGIDITKVKSAKYVNHAGQQKFNVVLDFNNTPIDFDKFREDILSDVTPEEIKLPKKENELALHLYGSDFHIGADVSSNSIYSNDYSFDVVESRLIQVRRLAALKYSQFGVFDTLVIFDLGDMLDGQNAKTTRGGHLLPQNMNNQEQFDSSILLYKKHISSIVKSGFAENYVFYATCNDNHSGDFSYYALRAIAEWCAAKFPQVKVVIQTKFIDVYEYGEHSFMVTHGKDKLFMKYGMPKYLDKKTEIYIKEYIENHKLEGNLHFIKGDLHQDCVDFCNLFRYRNCLSLFGSSEWIHTNIGYGRAGLSYDIVDKAGKEEVMEGRIFFNK